MEQEAIQKSLSLEVEDDDVDVVNVQQQEVVENVPGCGVEQMEIQATADVSKTTQRSKVTPEKIEKSKVTPDKVSFYKFDFLA